MIVCLVVSGVDDFSVSVSNLVVLQAAQVVSVEEQKDRLQAAATLMCRVS